MVDDGDLFRTADTAGACPAPRASRAGIPGWVTAHLRHPTDLDGFRAESRRLLAAGIEPQQVDWQVDWQVAADAAPDGERQLWHGAGAERGTAEAAQAVRPDPRQGAPGDGQADGVDGGAEDDAGDGAGDGARAGLGGGPGEGTPDGDPAGRRPGPRPDPPGPAAPRVPPAFLALCQRVVLHRDPARWALLYRLLWRLQHEPGLRHDAADADWLAARQMAREVQRDMHKMKAFVRFRELPGAAADGGPLFIAWFEPAHRIVQAVGPFFARRFANMHWAILTPELSLHWDGRTLHTGPAARRDDAPAEDAVEGLWLTYYEHIFNPARLNLRTMAREMPRRYWPNLPEASLIGPLAAGAAQRSDTMVRQAPTEPRRGSRRLVPIRTAAPEDDAGASEAAGASPGGDGADHRADHGADHSSDPWADHGADHGGARTRARPAHGATAHAQAPMAASLQALRQRAAHCRDCPLWEPATQTVFGEGAARAQLMLVGEQPGDQEDVRGRPFVGPAGKLLDRALGEVGLDRDALYVTNAVKHFKYELRGTRRIHKTPTQREAAACLHWLESEIDTVAPQALVALGATAARSLLGRPVSVMAERGQWLHRPDGRPVLVTLHPSALLRLPHEERDAAYARWVEDLRLALQPVPQPA